MTIWRHHGGLALGDCWAMTMWLLRESERTGQPARIALELPRRDYGPEKAREMVAQAARALDSTGTIEWVENPDETALIEHHWIWDRKPYIPTRKAWDGGSAGTVCHQFNGNSVAMLKNPPPQDIASLLDWMPAGTDRRLGLPLTLEQSIEELSKCALFIGVCSGMSHVAHSVGCPVMLIEYRQYLLNWHPASGWIHAKGTTDAITKAQKLYHAVMGKHDGRFMEWNALYEGSHG